TTINGNANDGIIGKINDGQHPSPAVQELLEPTDLARTRSRGGAVWNVPPAEPLPHLFRYQRVSQPEPTLDIADSLRRDSVQRFSLTRTAYLAASATLLRTAPIVGVHPCRSHS
ncbi:hypothetical protein, partial [Kribbella sancticallisti]|uniref:hypothetical protein n=1 Tax=Kribbella sancticallisti TaxID=460087 RepID=UPI0031D1AA71